MFFLLFITSVSAGDIDILNEVWHTRATQAMQLVASVGGTILTTETVIRSKGACANANLCWI